MPRPPRPQLPGAIYPIVSRGDGSRAVFHGDGQYARFTNGLADEDQRSAWDVIAYYWMRITSIRRHELAEVFAANRTLMRGG